MPQRLYFFLSFVLSAWICTSALNAADANSTNSHALVLQRQTDIKGADSPISDTTATRSTPISTTTKIGKGKRDPNKPWLSGTGFPFYKPTTSVGLGVAGILSFRSNKRDTTSFRSFFPLALLVSIRGQVSLMTGVNIFLNDNRTKLLIDLDADYGIANFFGHYSQLKDPEISDKTTHYTQFSIEPEVRLLYQTIPNLYVGPYIDATYKRLTNIYPDVYEHLGDLKSEIPSMLNIGVGGLVEYSSVDNPTFPHRGFEANIRVGYYHEAITTHANTYSVGFDYRQFLSVFNRRSVLAWRVTSSNTLNNHTGAFLFNPSIKMRGMLDEYIYAPSIGMLSLEYRHMFGTEEQYDRRTFWSRVGATAWGNIGCYGDHPLQYAEAIYSLGLGLRFMIQPNNNIRFDIGKQIKGRGGINFYIGFQEEF